MAVPISDTITITRCSRPRRQGSRADIAAFMDVVMLLRLPQAPAVTEVPGMPLRDLRPMHVLATGLLVLMFAIFVATSYGQQLWPWLAYPRAFAEAGMIGACADWFAVVALFRHPFGIPIPHTGIVPANKDRIGSALGRFITNNFLTAAALQQRLARIDVLGSLGRWLSEPANAKRLGDYF